MGRKVLIGILIVALIAIGVLTIPPNNAVMATEGFLSIGLGSRVNEPAIGEVISLGTDPTWQVGTGADDGYTSLATKLLYTAASAVQMGKHYAYLVQHMYEGFMRFTDITIPQGAIIDNAYLTFRAGATTSGTTVNLIIKSEDADNPSAVTSYDDYTNRSKTSGVAWSNVPAWTKDVDYDSPQIKTGIQTVVDRAGWASGNAMQIFVMDNGSSSSVANCYRGAYSYDGSATYAPKLTITYTIGEPDITVSPTTYNFGAVAVSTNYTTSQGYFTIDNTSSVQTAQTISVTTSTWSGGVGWAHSDTGTPDVDTAALYASRNTGTLDIIVKYSSPNYIYEDCPADTGYQFELRLCTPTEFNDGIEKTITVRITVVAD